MECKYCSRCIENRGSFAAHEKTCKSNPDHISYGRSPDAGRQKGCIASNKGKKTGYAPYLREKYPDELLFSSDCLISRGAVKRRILNDKLIAHECSVCGIGSVWNDKPMVLILDHINGVNNDNRLENLRFVCSNCDSQLDTYKAKNKKKSKEVVLQ